ncbi:glycerophosphodiester phosphodiesterase [Staphylococcus agnetis]|uniref:glycerophosphodiester phosphodiesterase n=1 Tax=Staphylococcus TaxID=1279 RepID=UPI000D1A2AD9|nr:MULTISPECIES: glycerophosphodiester phosphodiesterase [Staphylococcus]MCO4327120.1 glycerophosphodiester phosphodiesterase [Staphylococcus agnetis]MCO4358010.1 glycerophosphodiester phosphodiesterase [Staphylococcus agnetis]MCO4361504.1 glycerophosphodiester phosphodiesterase [Staphylococcus agnetis]MCO4368966.1 glycerophosphodiester phosphodiesterase [Staphylococcus agnetis]NHM74059.1 glycerophosphodiester phosphodiesterase [Staphylococcus sp. 11007852]
MTKTTRSFIKAINHVRYFIKKDKQEVILNNACSPYKIAPYFQHNPPYLLSHRGGMYERPEHTQLAFDHSQQLGLTGFEIDIRLTKDEHVVVFHDPDVDRTTNGSGLVCQHTLEELLRLDAGYHFKDMDGTKPYKGHPKAKIITLAKLLKQYPNQLINIDIKDDPKSFVGQIAAERLYEVIMEHHAQQRVLVTSFHKKQIERFNQLHHNKIATGASQAEVTEGIIKLFLGFPYLYKGQAHTFQMPLSHRGISLISVKLINWLNSKNIFPGYYGVNRLDLMDELVEKGVHTIVTDRPTIAHQFFIRKNDTSN